ncbi:MAG: hypothetical protein JNM36_16850 [Chitinophagales bacterium]|nr:hypothetical protein [Chitinophagales bacterium]
MMKKQLTYFFLGLIIGTSTIAQNIFVHPEFDPSWFGTGFQLTSDTKFCPIDGSANTTYQAITLQATNGGSGIEQFVFGADNANNDCNRWFNETVTLNTPSTFVWSGTGCPTTNDSRLTGATFTAGRYYTFRIKHNGYANVQGIVMETANAPVTFTNVSAVNNMVYGCLSAAPSAGEKVFIRYRATPTGTWQTIEATMGNGSITTANNGAACFTATVPLAATDDFEFYAITSTATDATAVQSDPDLYTLRNYGTDTNGQNGGSATGCPKMDNFTTRTTVDNHCVAKGGATITMDGAVDAGQYQYVTESQHAAPLIPETDDANAITNSDFVGESSARIVAYDAENFNYANYNDIQASGWGTADIKKFHASWDATYLYLVVEGPSADKYFGAGALDRMDLFVAIDKNNDIATNPYSNTTKLTATSAPWNKRVDFNGWLPDYFVAIDRVGPNPSTAGQGKNLTAGFHDGSDHGDYAALFATGSSTPLAEERNMGTLGTCPAFDVSANLNDLNNGIHEVRIPWALIGGKPDIYSGQRMNFAIYTTYDEIGFDTYDTGPGLGQGHGKPFEQIGDTPWDGDHWGGYVDPVTGTNDYPAQNNFGESVNADPYDSSVRDNGPGSNTIQGQQPASDDGNVNGMSTGDFDTVEGYYTIGNVGQVASKVECAGLPDAGLTASAPCTTAVPVARTGTFTETLTATNPVINGSSFVTNGGSVTITDAGGCYAEEIIVTANDVQTTALNSACSDCPANSYANTERTYSFQDNSRPTVVPIVDCSTPAYGSIFTACSPQTFVRTNVDDTPTISSTPTTCNGGMYSLTVNADVNTGTLEYALDGSSTYQSSNVFSGLANGSTHSVTVRVVGTTCTVAQNNITATCACGALPGTW